MKNLILALLTMTFCVTVNVKEGTCTIDHNGCVNCVKD